jgi:cytochrome c oxidase cbb3-type subunit 3
MRGAVFAALLTASVSGLAYAQQAANSSIGNAQAINDGATVYSQSCTGCHGASGSAGEIGPAIVSGEQADRRNDAQILATIRTGVPGTPMPAFAGKLADADILKLVAYLHALRGTAIDDPTSGDPTAGEAVFWGKGQCGSCHMIEGKGGLSAPDLSNIAGIRKTVSIEDALTKPRHHIFGDGGSHLTALPPMDTWLPAHVTTKSGKSFDGVLLNEDSYAVQIMGDDQKLHLFDRSDLSHFVVDAKSRMPTDYDKRLTPDEFRNLIAFLTRQGRAVPEQQAGSSD